MLRFGFACYIPKTVEPKQVIRIKVIMYANDLACDPLVSSRKEPTNTRPPPTTHTSAQTFL